MYVCLYANYRDSRRSGPAPGGALFEDARFCASVFHVAALSPRPGRCGAAVDAGADVVGSGCGCGGFDGCFAELPPPVGGTGSAGAADLDGDQPDRPP